jgi:mRNA-degrading endonuclease toxin of MazEF toxin-antitoxin module
MLNLGDTFLTGDAEDDTLHLWIILTPPSEGEVVTVSVTTRRRKSETLVQLHPGDHPFIAHESVIAYAYARIRTVEEI